MSVSAQHAAIMFNVMFNQALLPCKTSKLSSGCSFQAHIKNDLKQEQ